MTGIDGLSDVSEEKLCDVSADGKCRSDDGAPGSDDGLHLTTCKSDDG